MAPISSAIAGFDFLFYILLGDLLKLEASGRTSCIVLSRFTLIYNELYIYSFMFLYEKIQSFGLDAVSAVGEIGF